ncbi:MFS transporter [Algoriphagus boritolerans]|uniref:Nitrate/nitrite transporter NarK n=1 Tax=Algoriphagus boritolerans DSM 17298 = JCM 18970 TaxID=1120964 RepID=A0A1H6AGK0_9BACT|nr:MFS transporter [Algoriphagus boritolerans]SEG47512.1 Nitrate/nitrite transporter NarK [Algoriphagus boritolerans DSM 17298 = JCM 18970]
MPKQITSRSALILIVIAQFLGTSLWFAGNVAAPELELLLGSSGLLSWITSAVQLGFIIGTFLFAFGSISDRYSPSKVFFACALLAAASNIFIILFPLSLFSVLGFRFLVGFFLAGIYPVGMKIASDYFEKGLGSVLGFLVGALVLGTAFPFLIKALGAKISWEVILWVTSGLALVGGVMIGFLVPNGPFRKATTVFDLGLLPKLSKIKALRSASFGYFGHMWELYTFWAFLPLLILDLKNEPDFSSSDSFWTFAIIAVGGLSCAVGGLLSGKIESEKVALFSLAGSGFCGLILILFPEMPLSFVLPFLLIWGILVTADSPQFSTLVAQGVPAEYRGTALTLVNSIGFGLTILSIQLSQALSVYFSPRQFLGWLVIGPLVGIWGLKHFKK